MAYIGKLIQKQAEQLIEFQIKSLHDIRNVNEEIISDTQYFIDIQLKNLLENGKIIQKQYDKQLMQNKHELKLRLESRAQLENQLQRLSELKLQSTTQATPAVIIDETTMEDELKRLISLTKIRRLSANDTKEELFFASILQTAESCLLTLQEKGYFETKTIPILQSEISTAVSLLASSHQLGPLRETISEATKIYFKQLDVIWLIKADIEQTKNMKREEKKLLISLCDNLVDEIKITLITLTIPNPNPNEDKINDIYLKNIQDYIVITEARSKLISISSEFQGYVNQICQSINIEPVFTITMSITEMNKTEDMKSKLYLMKNENSLIDLSEEFSLLALKG